MAAISGGSADKVSNRFEHWWTAYRVAEMLRGGRVWSIRLEAPGDLGKGVEYVIEESTRTLVEQVKADATRWTTAAVIRRGILIHAQAHVMAGREFQLVVSSSAEELETITGRSRLADNFDEFRNVLLTDVGRRDLVDIARNWNLSEPEAWIVLRSVFVEHHTQHSLRRMVEASYEVLLASNPAAVVDELRSFFDDHLQQTITPTMIWRYLEDRGFTRRQLVGDDTTLNHVRDSLARQVRRVRREAPANGTVDRDELKQLREVLLQVPPPRLVVVDGAAGSGKSTIVTECIDKFERDGWFVGVVRLDGVAADARTARSLGPAMDLNDSPPVVLSALAGTGRALLLLDQLDAVSLYSGRIPDVFEAVDDALQTSAQFENLTVVAAVRTVDLENDPRLRALVAPGSTTVQVHVGDLSVHSVEQALVRLGVEPQSTTPEVLSLLRLPLHLAMFSRLDARSREPVRTRVDLCKAVEDRFRSDAAKRAPAEQFDRALTDLVARMSERETLFVPTFEIPAGLEPALVALESEGCLVRDRSNWAFFHETFFDFLFARSFVARGHDLHDFLVESGQHLFRRAQTRQIIEYLAAHDSDRMRKDVARLLYSANVRLHLKAVVLQVLRSVPATAADWKVVEPLAMSNDPLAGSAISLLSELQWFDAVDAAGRFEMWLRDGEPDDVNRLTRVFIGAVRHRPSRVAALLRPYISSGGDWPARLRSVIVPLMSLELVDFAIELIEAGLVDKSGLESAGRDFWSIAYPLTRGDENRAAGAARLVGAYLRRGCLVAAQAGSSNPFESGHLGDQSQMGLSIPFEIARLAPAAYLREVAPHILAIVGSASTPMEEARWATRTNHPHEVHVALFSATETAMRAVADGDPQALTDFKSHLSESSQKAIRFLMCRCLAIGGEADKAIAWLVADKANLELGTLYEGLSATRQLISAAAPSCSADLYDLLETTILAYVPEWERSPGRGRAYGSTQRALLAALPTERLSHLARLRLDELKRKFGHYEERTEEGAIYGGVAVSPVPEDAAEKMRDDQWLKALRKHSHPGAAFKGHEYIGGALQLAQVLQAQSASTPDRFASLARTFDETIPVEAMRAVIDGVSETLDIDALEAMLTHAADVYGDDASGSVCLAIRSRALHTSSTSIDLVERFTASTSETARSDAATAIAGILCAKAGSGESLRPLVARLAGDPSTRVRCAAADAIRAMLNQDREWALDCAERLLENCSAEHLIVPPVAALFATVVAWEPTKFEQLMASLLDEPRGAGELAGGVWARLSILERLTAGMAKDFASLPVAWRKGATEIALHNLPQGIELIQAALNDPDMEVRKLAGRAAWSLTDLRGDHVTTLIGHIQESPQYDECCEGLLYGLGEMAERLPPGTIEILERAVGLGGTALGDMRTAAARLSDHIASVTVRLYRQSDPETRARCLDIVDQLVSVGSIGIDEALDDER
jgi:hypothetical protein